MFYPIDNPHKQMASKAVSTLKILPDISDISLPLREKVSKFKLDNLKDSIAITVNNIVIEKARLLISSDKCCHAISW
jgi:hypothetical protein